MSLLSVSVVMSVFDRAEHVSLTIENVLAQLDVEYEFIIIDDGATKEVKRVLEYYSDNHQIKILEQANLGLTRALIVGCTQAKYPLIARIDAGDIMLSGRLQAQARILTEENEVSMVASWVDIVTEEGFPLYRVNKSGVELTAGARALDANKIITPFHASVMFRTSLYEKAGGYRKEFYFAQDCDLWSRMIRYGEFRVIERTLTKGLFSPVGISGRHKTTQQKLKNLVAESNSLRAKNLSDEPVLKKAKVLRPNLDGLDARPTAMFPAFYFLARCLDENKSRYAKVYWRRAISVKPWSLLAWAFYVRSWFFRSE